MPSAVVLYRQVHVFRIPPVILLSTGPVVTFVTTWYVEDEGLRTTWSIAEWTDENYRVTRALLSVHRQKSALFVLGWRR